MTDLLLSMTPILTWQGSKLAVPGRPNLPETLSDHQILVYQWPGGPQQKSGEGNSKLFKNPRL